MGASIWSPSSSVVVNNGVYVVQNIDSSGLTNVSASIQALIDVAAGNKLYVPEGHYRLDNPLTVSEALEIELAPGALFDFSNMPAGAGLGQRIAITVNGTTGLTTAITSNLLRTSAVVQVASTLGFVAGDWVMIRSNDLYSPGAAPGLATLGHFAKIKTVDSATQVTLFARSSFTYTAANNARMTKVIPLEGFKFSGGKILLGGVGSVHNGIRTNFCLSPKICNVTIDGGEDTGISFSLSLYPQAKDNTILNCTSPGGAIGNTGYGVANYSCEGGSAEGNLFFNCRHSVSGGTGAGFTIPKQFKVLRNDSIACGLNTWALDCHEPCFEWDISHNTVTGGNGGIVIRGPGTICTHNTVRDITTSGIYYGQFNNNIDGVRNCKIDDNVIVNCGTYGIEVAGNVAPGEYVHTSSVSNNNISLTGAHSILAKYCENLRLSGNVISEVAGTFQMGIYIQFSERVTVSGGTISMTAAGNGNAVFIENSSRVTVSGVTMEGNTSATTQDGVRANASVSQVSLIFTGNILQNFGRYGIHTTNSDRIVVTSNDLRDVVSGTKVLLTGAVSTVNTNNIV